MIIMFKVRQSKQEVHKNRKNKTPPPPPPKKKKKKKELLSK